MKVYIHGEGKLKECVCKRFAQEEYEFENEVIFENLKEKDFLIHLSDVFDIKLEREIASICAKKKIFYLRANLLLDEAYVGPLYEPGAACIMCVLNAMKRNHSQLNLLAYLETDLKCYQEYLKNNSFSQEQFSENVADLIMELVKKRQIVCETQTYFAYHNELFLMKEFPFQVAKHHIEPEEYCECCGHLRDDTREIAEIVFQTQNKKNPRDYRQNSLPDIKTLQKLLLDKDTGKIKHIFRDFLSLYIPFTGAELYCGEKIDLGYGRAFDYNTSTKCGILEALERYSGMYNKKSNSRIFGSYEDVKENAVNPETLGLHDESQYNMEGYLYKKYSEKLKYHWVWAWSMKHQKAVLIPEQMAYYAPELIREKSNRFVYETSNGCALGATIEEAILYGIFETIERDNFLVAWYNRLPLTEIDIENSMLKDVIQLKTYIESMGYEIHFFDMSMELKIPAVWGLIINPSRGAIVRTYSAAGAHFNPEIALRGALLEIVTSISIYEKKYKDTKLQTRREEMYRDDAKVTEFEDHVLLYSHPKALERLQYLIKNDRSKKTLREIYPEWYETNVFQHETLNEDLDEIIQRIFQYYDDIYVVQSTGELLKKCKLSSCKVLIPGMNTMSFGHQYRRMVLRRVLNGPVWAGRRKTPISLNEINLLPHPFP